MPIDEWLSFDIHSRDFIDFEYVYPVVSRRSRGVSVGINLNLNNTCNWRCVYCQVDNLVRGMPTTVNIDLLHEELRRLIVWILHGDFYETYVSQEHLRRLNDICISGNGEPTLSMQLQEVVEVIKSLRTEFNLEDIKSILITNGSRIYRNDVQASISQLSTCNGEVWFKIDASNSDSAKFVNQVNINMNHVVESASMISGICKTYIQTCLFYVDKKLQFDIEAYKTLLSRINGVAGIQLYTVAREPKASKLNITSVSADDLQSIADSIRQTVDLKVEVFC
jgi:wyosine [tRNA(Phe)-imidazoG37] synthetase (radical SAM superfamily)